MLAKGEFEVDLKPLGTYANGEEGNTLARMSIDKTFSGDLTAQSKGEMLSAMTAVQGSAGYVAIEQVSGRLDGKQGGFILQHFGTMQGDDQRLVLEVVPDSGTGELSGISGTMRITIDAGRHYYQFEYELT